MLFAACAVLLVAVAVIVNVQHWKLEPVLSGSMRPGIDPGDLVIVRPIPVDEIHVGEVIAYLPPHQQVPVLHRVIEMNSEGIITKGDANRVADPWGRVKPQAASVDRLVVVIPKVGFLHNIRPLLLKILGAAFILAIAIAVWATIRGRRKASSSDDAPNDGATNVATSPANDDTTAPESQPKEDAPDQPAEDLPALIAASTER